MTLILLRLLINKCSVCGVKEAHGIVAHAFESSTQETERQAYLREFETSVVYTVSSSTAKATESNLVSNTNRPKESHHSLDAVAMGRSFIAGTGT